MMMGGRAAEEIVIQDITTGASNDIKRATQLARSMVTEWGMSDLGCVYLGGDEEVFVGKSWAAHSDISDAMGSKIDAEIKRILDECYARALALLGENRKVMDAMVRALFEHETIFKADVDRMFDEIKGKKEEPEQEVQAEAEQAQAKEAAQDSATEQKNNETLE